MSYKPTKPIVEEPTTDPEYKCHFVSATARNFWECCLEGGHEGGHYMMTDIEYLDFLNAS